MLPFTMGELSQAIGLLSSGKAEGVDGVTTDMLMNTGATAQGMLLDLFNNVLIGGSLPSDWKIGDIVLILKKPPRSDINNYHLITLISCISELLTKMLAHCLSAAMDKEDVVGMKQNGFQAHSSCGDNILVHKTVLEFIKSKKLLSHLLFVVLRWLMTECIVQSCLQNSSSLTFQIPSLPS